MAKAFEEDVNTSLRELARRVLMSRFGGTQARMAEQLNISPAFLSDFLNEKRGAGRELLAGLGRFEPLRLVAILGIDQRSLEVALEDSPIHEGAMAGTPEQLRRAARAALELTGCTAVQVSVAALDAFSEYGQQDADADWWLTKIRDRLPRQSSGGGPGGNGL